jgi:hypothetical protein
MANVLISGSSILIASSSGAFQFDSDGKRTVDMKAVSAVWEVDPDDPTSVQFRVPKELTGATNDRIAFYVSGSGKIGVGTKNPEEAFDVRDAAEDKRDLESDTGDSDNRRESLLKLSRTANNVNIQATRLKTARNIGGVSFNGTGNINLPGVNTAGNQDTTGTAATASFVTGSAVKGNISGNAATATLAADATTLATARGIGGVNFDGSAAIVPYQHKGSITAYYLTPLDFYPISTAGSGRYLTPHSGGSQAAANNAATLVCNVTLPLGTTPTHVNINGSDTRNIVRVYICKFTDTTSTQIDGGSGFAVGTNTAVNVRGAGWRADQFYLAITVETDGTDSIYGGLITLTS